MGRAFTREGVGMPEMLFCLALAICSCWIPGGCLLWYHGMHPVSAFVAAFGTAFVLDAACLTLALLAMREHQAFAPA